MKFSRQMMLLVGIIALVVCLSIEQHIFWLTYFGATLFASAWGPVALMSIWSNRITASAAFWGILSGFLGNTIPKLLTTLGLIELPAYLDPILLGMVISLVVVLVVSRNTRVTDRERNYRLALLNIPAEELDANEARKTLRYAYALAVFGVTARMGLLRFYVFPYQQALFAGGGEFRFDWFSGEALFAYCWALIFVFLAWLMNRAIRKGYLSQKQEHRATDSELSSKSLV